MRRQAPGQGKCCGSNGQWFEENCTDADIDGLCDHFGCLKNQRTDQKENSQQNRSAPRCGFYSEAKTRGDKDPGLSVQPKSDWPEPTE